ncbi:cyclin-dependent kinase G-1-like [Salvia hispanica]|uniref:cyclin-dependent kinase G-1-like n=1 Tax=Salvia hispanica TaxID=49212 RepID=UPI002009138A|nr:cyclin-dependent kinase G-1-like [Salvia hispanica]
MAAHVRNNTNTNTNTNTDDGFALFRGRKTACKSKAPKGIVIKKTISVWPETMCSHNGKKRKLQSSSSEEELCNKKGRIPLPDYPIVGGYECLGKISYGSCGVVYKVQHKLTSQIWAMKKQFSGSGLSEISILQSLGGKHPSIVGFKEVAVDAHRGLYLVMEHMDFDLRGYMAEEVLPIPQVKMLMKQLIQGVNFLHQHRLLHRDLKPSNILVNKGGELKICDFGLAMRFGDKSESTVGTLCYMAPELLLGEKSYSCAVDVWAVGCVMAELLLRKVLFRGKSTEDQLHEIYCILGHPDNNNVDTTISSAKYMLSDAGFDLLKGLLTCDPTKRITSQSALNHAWLADGLTPTQYMEKPRFCLS